MRGEIITLESFLPRKEMRNMTYGEIVEKIAELESDVSGLDSPVQKNVLSLLVDLELQIRQIVGGQATLKQRVSNYQAPIEKKER